ncbi:MAG: hypothetical protein H7240_13185 [Glaciimonas sp.]|nr:hypothetical protein [Glaciimonas sp.]
MQSTYVDSGVSLSDFLSILVRLPASQYTFEPTSAGNFISVDIQHRYRGRVAAVASASEVATEATTPYMKTSVAETTSSSGYREVTSTVVTITESASMASASPKTVDEHAFDTK